jgi:hypothetical protein
MRHSEYNLPVLGTDLPLEKYCALIVTLSYILIAPHV